ncbi:MAG TPA: hypothetical protein VIO36_09020 [Anaerolineaceae bacterium]
MIKKLLSARLAGNLLLILFGLLIGFHLLVLFNLLPEDIVWGGRAASGPAQARTLELVSLVLTVLFAGVVSAKIGYIEAGKWGRVVNIALWVIFAYLVLNTLGNLVAISSLEKLIFTPLTLLAALLVLRLALER